MQPIQPMPVSTGTSTSPWTDLFNQLGPALIGGAGTYASGKQLQGYTDAAVNAAGYKPTTVAGPGGGITPHRNPDGSISYGVSGTGSAALGPLGQFASGATGAGSDVLSAFKNFNPQQFAQQQYGNLAALQAPTNTNQTQQMLNYEQSTGRGGLTQNGQLGDLGGLALAQKLGDTNLRMQAEQLASQRQSQLAGTASTLAGAGTGALNGISNYNSSLMDMLRTAMSGSTGQAFAGANQGHMMYDTGTARANQTGNLFGSTLQGLANSGGGVGSIFNSLRGAFNQGKGLYNGYQSLFGGASPADLYGTPGGMMSPGNISAGYGLNTGALGDLSGAGYSALAPGDLAAGYTGDLTGAQLGSDVTSLFGPSAADGAAVSGAVDPAVSSGYASLGGIPASAAAPEAVAAADGSSSVGGGAAIGAGAGAALALGGVALPLALAALVHTGPRAQYWSDMTSGIQSSDPNKHNAAFGELLNKLNNGEQTPYSPQQLASFGLTPAVLQQYRNTPISGGGGSAGLPKVIKPY